MEFDHFQGQLVIFNPVWKQHTPHSQQKQEPLGRACGCCPTRPTLYFMDPESYELVPINESDLSDNFRFVKENMVCKILSYKGNVFGVEPPNFVELMVAKTDPGFKGDTATNTTKPATLETGAEVKVPLFIDEGEMIQIDTRTGEYMGRA